jgi:hypothetical protein
MSIWKIVFCLQRVVQSRWSQDDAVSTRSRSIASRATGECLDHAAMDMPVEVDHCCRPKWTTRGPRQHRTETTTLHNTSTRSTTPNHSSLTTIELDNTLQNRNVLNRPNRSEELRSGRSRSSLVLHWLSRQRLCHHDPTLATMPLRHLPTLLSVTHPTDGATIATSQTTKDEQWFVGSDVLIVCGASCMKIDENNEHCLTCEAVVYRLRWTLIAKNDVAYSYVIIRRICFFLSKSTSQSIIITTKYPRMHYDVTPDPL